MDVAVRRQGVPRTAVLSATLVLLALLAAAGVYIGSQLTRPVDLGIFEPVAGRIVYGNQDGIWAVDPAASDRTTVQLTSEPGIPLGWSSDGTRLLIQKGDGNLFVLHADGSETQVTEQLSGFGDIPGSARPSGATISPDGSRVVFAGLTKTREEGAPATTAPSSPSTLTVAPPRCSGSLSIRRTASSGIRRSLRTGRRSRSSTATAITTTACG